MKFKIGDNVVYPGHGIGKINSIETKEIFGAEQIFYSITIKDSGMKIMVPKNSSEIIGLRPIMSSNKEYKWSI